MKLKIITIVLICLFILGCTSTETSDQSDEVNYVNNPILPKENDFDSTEFRENQEIVTLNISDLSLYEEPDLIFTILYPKGWEFNNTSEPTAELYSFYSENRTSALVVTLMNFKENMFPTIKQQYKESFNSGKNIDGVKIVSYKEEYLRRDPAIDLIMETTVGTKKLITHQKVISYSTETSGISFNFLFFIQFSTFEINYYPNEVKINEILSSFSRID